MDPVVGTEIAKRRPGLIISNDAGNRVSSRVIIAPLTSQGVRRVYPFEVLVQDGEAGLTESSKVLLNQLRAIDKQRLGRLIGTLSPERMAQVDRAIRISLAV